MYLCSFTGGKMRTMKIKSDILLGMSVPVAVAYGISLQAVSERLYRENIINDWDPEQLNLLVRILQQHGISENASAATLIVHGVVAGNSFNRNQVVYDCGLPVVQIVDAVLFMLESVRQNEVDQALKHARSFSGRMKSDILVCFAALLVCTIKTVHTNISNPPPGCKIKNIHDLSVNGFVLLYDDVARAVARLNHSIYDDFIQRWLALRQDLVPLISE
ncbi:MAG: hypothetical protein ABIH67_05620 [Candidatus Uhrbacteria bacterium]